MINELVKLSNHLDELGLSKEANFLDAVIERLSLKKSAATFPSKNEARPGVIPLDGQHAGRVRLDWNDESLEARFNRLEILLERKLSGTAQANSQARRYLELRIEALEKKVEKLSESQ